MLKKLISLILVFTAVFTATLPIFAVDIESDVSPSLSAISAASLLPELNVTESLLSRSSDSAVRAGRSLINYEYSYINKMGVSQLNSYISRLSSRCSYLSSRRIYFFGSGLLAVLRVKLMWLAAARIARLCGYPCAAKAVEYSVLGMNYSENVPKGGLFGAKILKTRIFASTLEGFKLGGSESYSGSIVFTTADNPDLYFSLHAASIALTSSESVSGVKIADVFDFAYDDSISNLFIRLVNNWAWLCQNFSVLNPVSIKIAFNA